MLCIQSTTTHGLCIRPRNKGARPTSISRILWRNAKNILRLSHSCILTKTATHEHDVQMQMGIRTSKACRLPSPSSCNEMAMPVSVVSPYYAVQIKFNPSAQSSIKRTEEPNAQFRVHGTRFSATTTCKM
jgi:hypothetical protein